MTDTTHKPTDDLVKRADAFRLGSRPTDADVDKANRLIDGMSARIPALTAERDALREAVDEVTEYAKRHEAERDALAEKLALAKEMYETSMLTAGGSPEAWRAYVKARNAFAETIEETPHD